jgi:hypothetical protein
VVFFRGRQPETSIWRRFRSGLDGFTFVHEANHYSAHVVANAERAVDLFYVLMQHLPPAVDVAIDDRRAKRGWAGERIALPDVQDAMGRLKVALAATGGVEIAIYTADDQITLNPQLELFLYARSDRWLYLLLGLGLEERTVLRTRSWKLSRRVFEPAPELSDAVAAAATRLGLDAT